jgi:DNA-directed RNA polymerase specialized sigma24 family protein
MSAEETKLEVHAVLQTLAPHFQSVMALREIEGLGCPEIAEIVGATHVTVRWRLHRARKLFLEEWQRRERVQAAGNEAKSTNDPSARP